MFPISRHIVKSIRCPGLLLRSGAAHYASSSTSSAEPQTSPAKQHDSQSSKSRQSTATQPQKKGKTQSQIDEELRAKMSGLAGDGGESGVEYENGQPVAMKRGVKDNMFRYI